MKYESRSHNWPLYCVVGSWSKVSDLVPERLCNTCFFVWSLEQS